MKSACFPCDPVPAGLSTAVGAPRPTRSDVLELREPQQREWIDADARPIPGQFREQEIACYQRFAVNDCLLDSRRTEREIMADLRRQEILINDAQRKRRAARQLLRADERLHGAGDP